MAILLSTEMWPEHQKNWRRRHFGVSFPDDLSKIRLRASCADVSTSACIAHTVFSDCSTMAARKAQVCACKTFKGGWDRGRITAEMSRHHTEVPHEFNEIKKSPCKLELVDFSIFWLAVEIPIGCPQGRCCEHSDSFLYILVIPGTAWIRNDRVIGMAQGSLSHH